MTQRGRKIIHKEKPISLHITEEVYKKLLPDAQENERSVTGQANWILKNYYANKEKDSQA